SMPHLPSRLSVAALLLVALSSDSSAQLVIETRTRVGLPGESLPVARRLERAAKLVAEKQWTDAVDEYQRILDEAGDVLVPLGQGGGQGAEAAGPRRCIHARWLCHWRLAALPPEALTLYRSRVDAQAKKWLEQGRSEHDARLLRRVVEETFCSRFTDRALDL